MCDQCLYELVQKSDDEFIRDLLDNLDKVTLKEFLKIYQKAEKALVDLLTEQGLTVLEFIEKLAQQFENGEVDADSAKVDETIQNLLNEKVFQEAFEQILSKNFVSFFETVGKAELLAKNPAKVWNVENKNAVKFAKSLTSLIPDMNEYTKKTVSGALSLAIKEGQTNAERSKLIRVVSEQIAGTKDGGLGHPFSYMRSMRIARTFSTSAANGGKIEGWKQSEVVKAKKWRSARNERTRKTHRIANGQIRMLDQHFQVGKDKLMHPGDSKGSAKEIVNCRCTMQSVSNLAIKLKGTYNDKYKEKLIKSHEYFLNEGHNVLEHALNRVQGNLRNKRFKSKEAVLDAMNNGKIYIEPDGTIVKHKDSISIHIAADNGDIKGIVANRMPKDEWREWDDK